MIMEFLLFRKVPKKIVPFATKTFAEIRALSLVERKLFIACPIVLLFIALKQGILTPIYRIEKIASGPKWLTEFCETCILYSKNFILSFFPSVCTIERERFYLSKKCLDKSSKIVKLIDWKISVITVE